MHHFGGGEEDVTNKMETNHHEENVVRHKERTLISFAKGKKKIYIELLQMIFFTVV